jgi:hypothetical protein
VECTGTLAQAVEGDEDTLLLLLLRANEDFMTTVAE